MNASPAQAAHGPKECTLKIGTVTIDSVHDSDLRMDPTFVYPSKSMEDWQPYLHLLDDGEYVNTIGGFLVRDGDLAVLVDVGVGPNPPAPFTSGDFMDSLAALGVNPQDITHVVFTHLHFDHIGWAVTDGQPTFPNAEYIAHADDWEYFFSTRYRPVRIERPQDRPSTQLAPIADQVKRWSGPELRLSPNLRLEHAPGHTPGECVLEINSNGERGLLLGDVAHHAIELIVDGWPGVADCSHDEARRSAARIAADLVATGTPFALAHFPGLVWATLSADANGQRTIRYL